MRQGWQAEEQGTWAGRRIWIGSPWVEPCLAPAVEALEGEEPERWLAAVCQPERILTWLANGIRWWSRWPDGRLVKLLLKPDEAGNWPAWVLSPGGVSGVPDRRRQWTPAEQQRRERKLERLMERWAEAKPACTAEELTFWWGRVVKMHWRMLLWLHQLAHRVKERVKKRRQRRHGTSINQR